MPCPELARSRRVFVPGLQGSSSCPLLGWGFEMVESARERRFGMSDASSPDNERSSALLCGVEQPIVAVSYGRGWMMNDTGEHFNSLPPHDTQWREKHRFPDLFHPKEFIVLSFFLRATASVGKSPATTNGSDHMNSKANPGTNIRQIPAS